MNAASVHLTRLNSVTTERPENGQSKFFDSVTINNIIFIFKSRYNYEYL